MIKRTPQEIADFFGCHIVQDADLSWLLFQEKPVKIESAKVWGGEHSGRIYQELIDVPEGHGWYTIYEPSKPDKAPHQSEVHTHSEYTVEHSYQLNPLISRIKCLMNDGWKPQGGIEVEHLPKSEGYADDACYYYQAMVRGI